MAMAMAMYRLDTFSKYVLCMTPCPDTYMYGACQNANVAYLPMYYSCTACMSMQLHTTEWKLVNPMSWLTSKSSFWKPIPRICMFNYAYARMTVSNLTAERIP
jgi:hypothetical protein